MTRYFKLLTLLGLWFAVSAVDAPAQYMSGTKVGIGLSTAWINGANPARDYMWPDILQGVSDSLVVRPGGSFDGQQPGIGLRTRFALNDTGTVRLMLGLDYLFYRGNWRLPLDAGNVLMEHRVDMTTGILGVEYVAYEFTPLARLYAAAEARASFLHSSYFNWEFVTNQGEIFQERGRTEGKPSTFRLGTALRIGLEGEFQDNFIVDTSVGYGVVNLTGRDDVRGQLLTTNNDFETGENLVGNILFSFILMYRI